MAKGQFKVFTILVFLFTTGIIGALVLFPKDLFSAKNRETQRTKVVIPQANGSGGESLQPDQGDETQSLKILLDDDEAVVAILTRNFKNDSFEEQIIAYRKPEDIDSPIYITYAEYNEQNNSYNRTWSAPTAAAKPGTLILYSEDLIGDGGICVLVSGMNNAGEQTLTVFRKTVFQTEPFNKIAELLIEGSIAVQEPENRRRNQGQSHSIATYGRDYSTFNIMDQIEVTYTFNEASGIYEQSRMAKIPGTQIEQRRVSELLNGEPKQFENFIAGLWYQPSLKEEDGASLKYVYFNTATREIIFYDNNSEEIFTWQNSASTRLGLHINSQNVALTKLRRTVNVELTSLETIRLRVHQDIYLRTDPNTFWDGSYQRVQTAETVNENKRVFPYLEGRYSNQDGTIVFNGDGSYQMDILSGPSDLSRQGQYVFFMMGEDQLLELRTAEKRKGGNQETVRETFKVTRNDETLTLIRVRIGTRGIHDLHASPIVLLVNGK
jgi:hypothetical protein